MQPVMQPVREADQLPLFALQSVTEASDPHITCSVVTTCIEIIWKDFPSRFLKSLTATAQTYVMPRPHPVADLEF